MKQNNLKYVSRYFFDAKETINNFAINNVVTMQFFQRQNNVLLAGMEEVLNFLKENTLINRYTIKYLPDGSIINALEPVLELEGHYSDFGIYEGIIDGILARMTSIATNAYLCKKAANNKEIIFMGDRADHYLNQQIDGKAVAIAGIENVSTLAQSIKEKDKIYGSIPHVLIQHFNGDIIKTMDAFSKTFPNDNNLIALVDFNNDVITDSLKALNLLKDKLYAVRVDTSKNMVDKMFKTKRPQYFGVNPTQIKKLRKELDKNGGQKVKIVVSSGFDAKKIAEFEKANAPVDAYGVGEGILKINIHFTGDAVKINGQNLAKKGRKYRDNPKLITYIPK